MISFLSKVEIEEMLSPLLQLGAHAGVRSCEPMSAQCTLWATEKKPAYFFVCNFIKKSTDFNDFSLLDLKTNGTHDGMNFTHFT